LHAVLKLVSLGQELLGFVDAHIRTRHRTHPYRPLGSLRNDHSSTASTAPIPPHTLVLSRHVGSLVQVSENDPCEAEARNLAEFLWTALATRLTGSVGVCPYIWVWLAALWPWFSCQNRR